MDGGLRTPGSAARGDLADAVAALRHLYGLGHPQPALLAYYPVARTNPYQDLLYRRTWDHGLGPVPLDRLDVLEELSALRKLGCQIMLHLHWTNRILGAARTEDEADDTAARFLARLDAFIEAGGRVGWTVHNVLPHDARLPAAEARLQQAIVDRAIVVHVLTEDARTLVSDWFTIPDDRALVVPHSSYAGVYPDVVSEAQARYALSIDPDETVYLFFGAIKQYKGVDDLIEAFEAIAAADPGRHRLLVAGQPDPDDRLDRFLEWCRDHPAVALFAQRIDPSEVQLFMRAADVVVLPYRRSLNSGVLMLAFTFGRPVIVPSGTGLAGLVTPEVAVTFEPNDPSSLEQAMRQSFGLRTERARGAALEIAHRHNPDTLADAFARSLRARLDAAGARGPSDAPGPG